MTRFASLLLPLDGSPEASKSIGCALWLAETLGATLHVLHATEQPIPGQDALARLGIPHAQRAQVVVHQLGGAADDAVLSATTAHRVDLVVMSARGESVSARPGSFQRVGTVAQTVLKRSPVPVLLLPLNYREVLPWKSMLAAASGETAADQALEAAISLATALNLKVTVVHSEDRQSAAGTTSIGSYADTPHYEYSRRLEDMAIRGLTGSTREECSCIDEVLLRSGDPAKVLLDQVSRLGSSVLVLGWHGTFGAGRAPVLKRLLEEAECALLLVRGAEESRARLKVGKDIDE